MARLEKPVVKIINPDPNIHANTTVIGNKGVLIRGKAGAGKSQLSLYLVERAHTSAVFAALVADDQTFLSSLNNRLIARCPAPIVNSIEIRGYGIADRTTLPSAIIHLVADLVPNDRLERMPTRQTVNLEGVSVPLIQIPCHREHHAEQLISTALANLSVD